MARYKYVGPADFKHRKCDECKAEDRDVNLVLDSENDNKQRALCGECTELVPGQPKPLW